MAEAMGALHVGEVIAGIVIVSLVLYDLFQSVVLPRPAVGKLRLTPIVVRPLWRGWRWVGTRPASIARRENWLATFAPSALITLLLVWSVTLILGYGLVLDGLGTELAPHPANLGQSLYISATTLLPLGSGGAAADEIPVRLSTIAESATGIALAALVITLLFSLYASFQDREELVVALDAFAGAPPSGVHILETASERGMRPELTRTFEDWRRWSAAVLESHLAYPLLLYFRSSHDNEAWLNSFGAVMDAATLVISIIDDDVQGPARLMMTVGNHLVEDLAWLFRLQRLPDPIVERAEFDQARERIKRAGYHCRHEDEAWERFSELRSAYASVLNQVARYLAIIPAQWIGDRSYLPHRERGPGRRRGRRGRTA